MGSLSRSVALLSPAILLASMLFCSQQVEASVPTFACSNDEPPSHIPWNPVANETRMFNIGGREIHVTIPSKYDRTVAKPLYVAFHDNDMTVEEMQYVTKLSDPSMNNDAIVIYPKTKGDKWQSDVRPLRPGQKADALQTDDADVEFIRSLIDDLQQVLCFDTTNIHGVGVGTGGGMMHMLACNEETSTRFASFASIAGGYGRDDEGEGVWSKCTPSRKPVPILAIHGEDDKILPYYLNTWEDTKKRLAVPMWLDRWAELNGCGEETLEDVASKTEKRTSYIRLEGGGVSSKGDQYGTGIIRTAKACPRVVDKKGEEIKKVKSLPLKEPGEEETSLLHFRLRGVGHDWPSRQFIRLPELRDEEEEAEFAKLGKKKAKGQKLMFDTTVVVLDWFKSHPLPEHYAKKWKDDDVEAIAAREEAKKTAKESAKAKKAEQKKLVAQMEEMYADGKISLEDMEDTKKKIGFTTDSESEFAGFGEQDDDDEEEEGEEEKVEKKKAKDDTDEDARDEL